MTRPAMDEHQRRRWLRPNAHLYIRQDAWRFMPPGSPRYVGRDVVKYFWPEGEVDHESTDRGEAADPPREIAGLLAIKQELAALRADISFRKLIRALKAYNPDQPRVPAGTSDGGQWTSTGAGTASKIPAANPVQRERRIQLAGDKPPLRRLHSDSVYETDRSARQSLDYWRQQSTDRILESLRPGNREALQAYPDGTIANGNTRTRVLQERGYDINSLPREIRRPNLPGPRGGGGGFWPWQ